MIRSFPTQLKLLFFCFTNFALLQEAMSFSITTRTEKFMQPSKKMADAPSPLIPFVLVTALILVILGPSLQNISSLNLISLLVILLILLRFNSINETIKVPLTLFLIFHLISNKMLIAPLVLILIIYFVSIHTPTFQLYYGEREEGHVRDRNESGFGPAFILFSFIILYYLFHGGEDMNGHSNW